jgi:hypothetical protein
MREEGLYEEKAVRTMEGAKSIGGRGNSLLSGPLLFSCVQ